jgi:exo-beta-1,3-glucanase (GH17 family)
MKQMFVSATLAIVFAAFFTGCAGETTGPSETGTVSVNLIVGDTDVTAVSFEVVCDSGITLSGQFNVNDDQDPPIWAAIMDLPPGPCSVTLTAFDDQGAVLCTGSEDFTVLVDPPTVKVNIVLTCGEPGFDPLGNVDIDATFEFVEGNNCPRLHFLNAVPNKIPEGGASAVTLLVSDADGDPLTTALTATSGSFADPAALSTTYTCGSSGTQTISVSVSDGVAACDKTKSFEVECGGASLICEYTQDFEGLDQASLTALANDGWIVFGNVFDGETGDFLFNYGAFPAPNNPAAPAFSLIATGQGGPEQGEQQLVIISDYNARDEQDAGDRVQANTFQQRTIVANDVGKTLTFSFDAKRGNINDPADPVCSTTPNPPCDSTALAFIRTVDPGAGFAVTNDITLDTTNLPVEWMRDSIEIEIDAGLVGQLLQFGFSATASNDEPSGNVYDNITFCTPGDGGGIELRPLPEIYTTGKAINYGPYRAGGPGTGEIPSDADILEDLGLLQTAGYNLLRLFGADPVHQKILQLAEANFPEMRFQQGLFLEGLSGADAANCDSAINDSQVATAIQLANTYSSVVTVSVGNETSFYAPFMPLDCLEDYITETRNKVTQPVTADDDYTFYANFFGRSPDNVLNLIDFVSIHTYPFLNYRQWDWKQEAAPVAGLQRAEAMMNASLAKAQQNYQAVYDYRYVNAGTRVTIGESLPIVIGETGWKWRQTNPNQEIEEYAADPVNAKWYYDLMLTWERSPGGPPTIFIFSAFDEEWKQEFFDDGWGFWDELRQPNYVLCDTPAAGSPCNVPLYQDAGFFTP